MRKPKLAIVLPVTLFGVELILWYWGRSTSASVWIGYEGIRVSAAAMVSFGLDPIALLGALLLNEALSRTFGFDGSPGFERLVFLVFVLVTWYLIGIWLDRRASEEGQQNSSRWTVQGLLLPESECSLCFFLFIGTFPL